MQQSPKRMFSPQAQRTQRNILKERLVMHLAQVDRTRPKILFHHPFTSLTRGHRDHRGNPEIRFLSLSVIGQQLELTIQEREIIRNPHKEGE
jgi:hypothetical protein